METERLILRKFTSEDWKDLHEYLSEEEVVKYEPYDTMDEEACKAEAIRRSNNEAFWAVCLKENNKLIGNVYFEQQEPKDFMTWELGYVFNAKYGGKGYATEACKCILAYGFEEIGCHRIVANCNQENGPSWRLLERLSMRREAQHRKPAFFRRDINQAPIWFDAYQYAMLADEWQVGR